MIESMIGDLEQKVGTSQPCEVPPYFCEKMVALFPLIFESGRSELWVRYKDLCEKYITKTKPIIENEKKFFPHQYIGE